MYLNKVFLIGNLTRDPELKSLPSGTKVASFGLATNRKYKDKDGNWADAVDFHNIVVFGRQAETTSQYLKKGASAMIEGRIQTRSWDGQDGKKNYRTEIVADRVQFGPRRDGAAAPEAPAGDQGQAPAEQLDTIEYPSEDINPDDIPF
ncbi:single-stranded DNA-binding protein [Patescibacteria group bacterium]